MQLAEINYYIHNIYFYIFLGLSFLIIIFYLMPKNHIEKYDLKKIDKMKGLEFEIFIGEILKNKGYLNVQVTKGSGDFGVDVICNHKRKKYVFQVKRYSNTVGVGAIQEIVAGKLYYKADQAVAITNSYFTKAAIEMANKCNVRLINRDDFKRNNIYL